MAAFLVTLLLAVEIKDWFPKGHWRHLLMLVHVQLGLSVLLLALPRIILRLRAGSKPDAVAAAPAWQERAAAISHGLFYVVMVAMPVLGILTIQLREHDVRYFGWLLPNPFDDDSWLPYALPVRTIHEYFGDFVIGLIGLHWCAVFWHQVVLRDNILARMRL